MKPKKLFALVTAAAIAAVSSAPIQSGVVFAGAAGSGTFVGTSYYEQLDQLSKDIYDILYEAYKEDGDGEAHDVIAAFEKNEMTGYEYESGSEDKLYYDILEPVYTAYCALFFDHPELTWISFTSIYFGISDPDYDSDEYELTEALFSIVSGYEYGTAEEMKAAVEKAAAEIEYSNDRYEMIKNIHDYICDNVDYNYTAVSESVPDGYDINWYQTAYSAFYPITSNNQLDDAADDNSVLTVCEGYAKAFKILCDYYGIPCVVIVGRLLGEDHAWNYVQMEDGEWYAVDVTNDDEDNEIEYLYFLVGSGTVYYAENDKGGYDIYTFGQLFEPSIEGMGVPSIPVLSESEYIYDPDSGSSDGVSSDSGGGNTDNGNPETGVVLAFIPAAAVAAAIVATKNRK